MSQEQKHATKYKHTSRSKNYKAKGKASQYALWYRRWRALLVRMYGGRCQWHIVAEQVIGYKSDPCDASKQDELEFAHIKETGLSLTLEGRGSYTRLKDILDNPDSYALLCTDHHKILDGRDNKL